MHFITAPFKSQASHDSRQRAPPKEGLPSARHLHQSTPALLQAMPNGINLRGRGKYSECPRDQTRDGPHGHAAWQRIRQAMCWKYHWSAHTGSIRCSTVTAARPSNRVRLTFMHGLIGAHLIARPCWLTSAGQIGLHTNRKIMYQLKLLGNTVQSAATVKDSTPYTHVQKQPTMGSLVGVEESAGPLGMSDAGYTRLTQPGRSSVGFSIPFACNNAYVTDSALLPAHTRSVFHHCCRSWEKRSQSDPRRQETEGLPGLFWYIIYRLS